MCIRDRDIRAVGAAHVRAFIPIEAQPAQPVHDGLDGPPHGALLVGVLDAQNKPAAMLAGEQPVIERGARPADVEVAGGAGSETYANGHKENNPQISRIAQIY